MRKSERKWPVSNRVIYFFMGLLAVFMHFYKLGSVPYGLHIDEAGMAYDAFCLANYSVDRYLNHLPVYLTNFGGGQSALYGYLTAGLIKLTGMLNPWIIRLPGALIGMLGYFSGIGIVRKSGRKMGTSDLFFYGNIPLFYYAVQIWPGLQSSSGNQYIWGLDAAQGRRKEENLLFCAGGNRMGNLLLYLCAWIYWKHSVFGKSACVLAVS